MILCTGDLHGTNEITRLKRLKEYGLTQDDTLIIAGDAGLVWHNINSDYYDKDTEAFGWIDRNVDCMIAFVDGNHENHPKLNKYPVIKWNGGNVHKITDKLIHLMRGEFYTIDGQNIWVMGGAYSTDKKQRTEGISWWPEEQPTHDELYQYYLKFEEIKNQINYVITHECPYRMYPFIGIVEILKPAREYPLPYWLDQRHYEIAASPNFKKWVFGHHHIDHVYGTQFRSIYQDIIELQ